MAKRLEGDVTREADVEAGMSVLFGGVFLGMKYAAPVMKQQRSGCILNNASVAGIRVGYGPTIYSAAKAAVIQLSKCVAPFSPKPVAWTTPRLRGRSTP